MSIILQAPVQQPGSTHRGTPDVGAPAVGSSRLRLTRRGRVVVLAVLVALMLAAFTVGRSGESRASTDRATRAAQGTTTVHAGESLWAVAHRVNPGHDPRALVQAIRDLNHLSTATVQAGQQLLLPKLG